MRNFLNFRQLFAGASSMILSPATLPGTQIEGQRFSSEIAVRSPSSLWLLSQPFVLLISLLLLFHLPSLHFTAPHHTVSRFSSLRFASPRRSFFRPVVFRCSSRFSSSRPFRPFPLRFAGCAFSVTNSSVSLHLPPSICS